jgi:hypothetical protein
MVRSIFFSALLCLAAWTSEGAAQRAQGEGSLSISARLDGKTYQAAGRGNCRHAPTASIYDVPAALWTVEYTGSRDASIRQLNLTLWRPKNGAEDQFSISLDAGSAPHRINVGGRGDRLGSGTVSLSPAGAGGRFAIKGKDAAGTMLEVTIDCPVFAGIEAEGG